MSSATHPIERRARMMSLATMCPRAVVTIVRSLGPKVLMEFPCPDQFLEIVGRRPQISTGRNRLHSKVFDP